MKKNTPRNCKTYRPRVCKEEIAGDKWWEDFFSRHWKQTTTPSEEITVHQKRALWSLWFRLYSTTTTCFYDKFKLSKPIVWKKWHQQPLVTRLLGRGRKQERTNCAIRVARPGVFAEGENHKGNMIGGTEPEVLASKDVLYINKIHVHKLTNTITCFTDLVAYISKKVKILLSIFSQPYSRTTRKHRWPHSGSTDFRNLSRGRWVPSTSVAHTSLAQACEHRLGPSHSLSLQKLESCNGPGLFRLKKNMYKLVVEPTKPSEKTLSLEKMDHLCR